MAAEEVTIFQPPGFKRERFWNRRIFKIQATAFFVLCVVLFLFNSIRNGGGIEKLKAIVTFFVVGVAYFIITFLPGMIKEAEKDERKLKDAYSGVWELTARQDGLVAQYGKRMDLITWEQIKKIEANPLCLYLDMGDEEHLILPRKKVVSGDYDAFVEAVCLEKENLDPSS